MNKNFDIKHLLDIVSQNRYAATVAAFEIVDMYDQIQLPNHLKQFKPSVAAIEALNNKLIKWDYISDERRKELYESLLSDRASIEIKEKRKPVQEITENTNFTI